MKEVRFTYHVRPLPKLGKIRTQNECDRGEHILNIIMVIVAVIVIGIMGFFVVRHCIGLDEAALNMTQQEWDALGGDYGER